MDLCSLEDAFPNIESSSPHRRKKSDHPFPGGTDAKATKEERRAAKKKAKRCKGPALEYQKQVSADLPPTDPDRPALFRMDPVEAMTNGSGTASLYAPPVGQQPLPKLPGSSCLFSDQGFPSYFGKGEEDPEEGEGFADFSTMGGDDPTYRLVPDFTKVFNFKGVEKATGGGTGGLLPEPNLNDSWKPSAPGASYSAFYTDTPNERMKPEEVEWSADDMRVAPPTKGVQPAGVTEVTASPLPSVLPSGGNVAEDRDKLLARIDELMGRLEQLEKQRRQDTQNELLLFVGTGLFVLVGFHMAGRR
jgi:hypothetical protein